MNSTILRPALRRACGNGTILEKNIYKTNSPNWTFPVFLLAWDRPQLETRESSTKITSFPVIAFLKEYIQTHRHLIRNRFLKSFLFAHLDFGCVSSPTDGPNGWILPQCPRISAWALGQRRSARKPSPSVRSASIRIWNADVHRTAASGTRDVAANYKSRK